MITFTCKGKGCSPRQWEGSLEILRRGNPCEAELSARGSRFPPDRRKAFLRELSVYPQLGCWYRTLITDRYLLERGTPPALQPNEKGRCLYHRISA